MLVAGNYFGQMSNRVFVCFKNYHPKVVEEEEEVCVNDPYLKCKDRKPFLKP
jgi:hypothetical protein